LKGYSRAFIMEAVRAGVRPEMSKKYGVKPLRKQVKDLIVRCWSQDPHNRPDFKDIIIPEFQ
jgi:hypothetical protein